MKLLVLALLVCAISTCAWPSHVNATIDRIVDGDWIVAICDDTLTEYIMHVENYDSATEGEHITLYFPPEDTWYPLLYNLRQAITHESLQPILHSNNPELVLEELSPGINQAFWNFLTKHNYYNEEAQHLDRLIHALYEHDFQHYDNRYKTFPPLWVALHDLTYQNMPSIIDHFLYETHRNLWIFTR